MKRRTFLDLENLLNQGLDEEVQFSGQAKVVVQGSRKKDFLNYQGQMSLIGYDHSGSQTVYHLKMGGGPSIHFASKLGSKITYNRMLTSVEIPLDIADESTLIFRYLKDIKF